MSFGMVDGVFTITSNAVMTTALAAVLLMIGFWIKSKVKFLNKYCIPAPVVGGFLFMFVTFIGFKTKAYSFSFDTSFQSAFMLAFFTTVGLGASMQLLKKGGVLLNFDANYGITDFSNVEDLPENHAHNMLGNEMMRECEEIKRQLPISSYSRPAWDLETLGAMSLKEFHVDLGISSRIYLEKDEFYNPTPLFMLRTVK